ncbi:MAG TPA: DEAD/DEAH box helicase [Longimicrobiales bacterium]|nr:DEAD/DEAH box helicase [Longimicrobiales bacterium]
MTKQDDFAAMELHPRLLAAVKDLGFSKATPVQTAAIPAGLAGRDVLGCAATGSGKTAAFALPILERLMNRPRGATRALVLVPTRELAAQVEEHFRALGAHTGTSVASIFGGVAMAPQVNAFKRGVDVMVATPGRLLDHFGRDHGALESLEVLVVDEADRMLDMGFLPEIRKIIAHLPKTPRQTFFFSATMPPAIMKLADDMLKQPEKIAVQRKQAPAAGVAQALYQVGQQAKVRLLAELIDTGVINEAIVFCRTKHRSNRVAQKLENMGISVARIHGNRSQKQRTEALADFKSGKIRILVATDILARGIDVEALEHVVNFDVPATPEDYVHRVGRTGRADLTGDAYTFAAPEEASLVREIEKRLGKPIPRRTQPGFDYSAHSEELEIPLAERLAKMRAERAGARQRAAEKAARNGGAPAARNGTGRNGGGRNAKTPSGARNTASRSSGSDTGRDAPPQGANGNGRKSIIDNRDVRHRGASEGNGRGGSSGGRGSSSSSPSGQGRLRGRGPSRGRRAS